jgi:hypothetical protein
MGVAMAMIFLALALGAVVRAWGERTPDAEWSYEIKFRGKPPLYVPRELYVANLLSLPVAIALFLPVAILSYRYRDREPPDERR